MSRLNAILVVFVATLALPSALAREIPDLRVGFVLPLSGPQKPFADELMRGAELALESARSESADKQTRKLATHVTFLSKDENQNGRKAAAKALFEKERAHVLVGSVSTPSTLALAEQAKAYNRPLVSPLSTADSLPGQANVFSVAAPESVQTASLARFVASEKKSPQAAALIDGSSRQKKLAKTFATNMKNRGGKLVAVKTVPENQKKLRKVIEGLESRGVGYVFLPAFAPKARTIMKIAAEAAPGLRLLGLDVWAEGALVKGGGPQVAGHLFTAQFSPDRKNPAVEKFAKAFRQRHDRAPGAVAALGYDTMNTILEAFSRSMSTLRDPLLKGFKSIEGFSGVTGTLSYAGTSALQKRVGIRQAKVGGSKFRKQVPARFTVAQKSSP